MIFVHDYYAQPIYYTDVSKWCESITDWSIPLTEPSLCFLECVQPHLTTLETRGGFIDPASDVVAGDNTSKA